MPETIFYLKHWDPETAITASELTEEIYAVAPELTVLYMGAAALRLPGKNDVDLDVLCPQDQVPFYVSKLLDVLGTPKENNGTSAAWLFERDGIEVDCMLSDPTISHVPSQQKVFELLSNDNEVRARYLAMKQSSNGLPYAEYVQRKKAFYDEILSSDT